MRSGFTMNKILGNNKNQACSILGKAHTRKKSCFRMPNIIISKGATPMNPDLERTMLTSKSYAQFDMQIPFKIQSIHPDSSRCQYIDHFTLKE